ncbi:MAG: hypothetical protein CMD99_04850 [Gammaproteobacteria bacterium]|nr:hypothetical protein [Gammaproteobacteria bacterium]
MQIVLTNAPIACFFTFKHPQGLSITFPLRVPAGRGLLKSDFDVYKYPIDELNSRLILDTQDFSVFLNSLEFKKKET